MKPLISRRVDAVLSGSTKVVKVEEDDDHQLVQKDNKDGKTDKDGKKDKDAKKDKKEKAMGKSDRTGSDNEVLIPVKKLRKR